MRSCVSVIKQACVERPLSALEGSEVKIDAGKALLGVRSLKWRGTQAQASCSAVATGPERRARDPVRLLSPWQRFGLGFKALMTFRLAHSEDLYCRSIASLLHSTEMI